LVDLSRWVESRTYVRVRESFYEWAYADAGLHEGVGGVLMASRITRMVASLSALCTVSETGDLESAEGIPPAPEQDDPSAWP
jgi:hypothetical protein